MMRFCIFSCGWWLVWAGAGRADPGHEKIIAELTAQLEAGPPTPERYFQRGWHYKEVPLPGPARADFGKALALNAAFLPAKRELARLEAEEGRLVEAVARLKAALEDAGGRPAAEISGCASLLAEYHLLLNQPEEARAAVERGLKAGGGMMLDLILAKAEALRRLGRGADRVRCLKEDGAELRSGILEEARMDALIDEGRVAEVLPEVESRLAAARYPAPWLIRRARIRRVEAAAAGKGKDDALLVADRELRAALAELDGRIAAVPESGTVAGPDLFCDRGVARVLLGDVPGARGDLGQALVAGAEAWRLRVLESLLPVRAPGAGK